MMFNNVLRCLVSLATIGIVRLVTALCHRPTGISHDTTTTGIDTTRIGDDAAGIGGNATKVIPC